MHGVAPRVQPPNPQEAREAELIQVRDPGAPLGSRTVTVLTRSRESHYSGPLLVTDGGNWSGTSPDENGRVEFALPHPARFSGAEGSALSCREADAAVPACGDHKKFPFRLVVISK